ncbi:MAG: DUF4214 domain-containing protein [Sphingomonadaceae bacterium]
MATNIDLIQQLYVAYYNRPADVAGLNYWVAALDAGATIDQISKSFNSAAEYTAAYAGKSPEVIVDTVYMNLFGRHAESGGLDYWGPKVQSGAITTADLVKAISAGAYGTDGTLNADGLALANKVTAAEAFTTELNTAGNEAERIAYASGTAAVLNAAKTFIAGVTDDASLATALAGVHAAAQNLIVVTTPTATITLTSGIDTGAAFVGGAGNDVFDATKGAAGAATLNALDSIDGGAGTDTLNVAQTAAIALTSSTIVKNINTANLVSGGAVAVNAAGWTGLDNLIVASVGGETVTAIASAAVTATDSALAAAALTINGGSSVNVTASGSTTGTITVGTTVAPTGAITISNTTTGAVSAGTINVAGGTTVKVTQAASNAVNTTQTNGSVNVAGGAATTSVTVAASAAATASGTVAGVNANTVNILDVNAASATKAGTITSVSVDSFTTLSITDNALTTLSVANGSGNIIIDNSGLTTATNKTLALTINGQTGGTLDDADIYTTLNVTTTGANSTLANITEGAVTALSVAGTKTLALTSTAGLTALKTVTVSGAAGLTADLSGATVTSVSTAASTGKTTVTIDASKATFTGGAGVDKVTLAATNATKAISLGAGDDSLTMGAQTTTVAIAGGTGTDTLSISAASAAVASADATFAGLVTGFEQLTLTGATNQTIDLAVLGNYNYVTTSGGNGLTLSNLSNGGTLALTGAGTAYTIGNSAFTAGTNDVVNLTLTADATGAGTSFASTGITASGVEKFAITTVDTGATPTGANAHLVTLLGNSASTITVAGNDGLNLTATSTAATLVDASGITLGGFTFTSGALAAAAAIKGSATGTNTVTFSAATGGAVTYTGGTGVDTITASNGKANIIHLGSGTTANTVTGAGGNMTIDSTATGTDTVTLTTGNNNVSLGNGVNNFTATSGNNVYVGGTGVDTITVGGGVNTITTGTGADVVTLTTAGATVNTYSTITDAHAGMQIAFTNLGTETFVSAKVSTLNPNTAVFQDFANAVVAGATQADHSTDGAFGWFQFGGNTYLVEVKHSTVGGIAQTFVNGVDQIVCLTGLVDLSTATGGTTNILTLG